MLLPGVSLLLPDAATTIEPLRHAGLLCEHTGMSLQDTGRNMIQLMDTEADETPAGPATAVANGADTVTAAWW